MNKKNLASLFVLFALLGSIVAFAGAEETDAPVKIVIDAAHETAHAGDMEGLPEKLESWGYTVETITDEITSSALADARILLVPVPMGYNYSQEEIDAVVGWFNAGDASIWITGDSDYDGPDYIPDTNTILMAIGSSIMLENASVEEPNETNNDGSPYRVVVTDWNADSPLAVGVDKETFHGPTFLYGLKDASPVNLATTDIENVQWVAKTSADSVLVRAQLQDIMTPEYADMPDGATGPFVMMATETKAGDEGNSKIVLSSETIFTSYKNMNMDGMSEKGNHEIQGETLLKNTLNWMQEDIEDEGSSNNMIYAGIVIIIIIIGAAVTFMRRK